MRVALQFYNISIRARFYFQEFPCNKSSIVKEGSLSGKKSSKFDFCSVVVSKISLHTYHIRIDQ